jgi:hypothetical protein
MRSTVPLVVQPPQPKPRIIVRTLPMTKPHAPGLTCFTYRSLSLRFLVPDVNVILLATAAAVGTIGAGTTR